MGAFLAYGFMQRALAAGLFIALACAVLGVFLILRKDAMIGHGLSHITFAGVALGLLVRALPLAIALAFTVAASLGIMKLKDRAGLYGDTAIAIVSSSGLALGIILATLSRNPGVSLLSYLFGEILAIDMLEVVLSVALAAAVIAVLAVNFRRLMFMTFDREAALVAGVPVRRLDTLLTVLTSITIVLGMKVAGILLVSALLVIPAAAGLLRASSFRKAVVLSAVVSIVSVTGGLAAAYALDLPASGTIVLLSLFLFGGLALRRRKAA